jgi:tetratricopeptide (TPR) repeat protein
VVNDRGEVCGVLVANEAAQQQLAYAVAASEVRAFLDSGKRLWNPTTAEDYRERGRYLLRLGLAKNALEAFTEAARQSDSSPGDCRLLASTYLRLGDHERARSFAARTVAAEPRSAPGQVLLAEAVLAAGDTAAALKHCDDAIRLDPKHAKAFAVRGESLRLLGQADEALKTWEEAIWLAPGCAAAYHLRGRHFERTGDREKALHDYGRAAELEPTNPAPLRRRAAILLEVKEWKKAVAECERLLEVAPVDAEAFLQLGRAWLGFGDDAKALTAFTSAARLAPDGLRGFVAAAYKHADDLAARRPGDPERPAEWLGRVLASLRAVERESLGERAARLAEPLEREKDAARRIELLRSALNSLEGSDH